jgi:hypothetical protein
LTRFFTTLAAVTVLGTCGFAQAPVENATEIFFVRDNSGKAFELIQYKQ